MAKMKSILSKSVLAVSLFSLSITPTLAQDSPAFGMNLNATVDQGCFSSSGGLQDQGSYTFQSKGWCQPLCVKLGKTVMATAKGSNCWCGDLLPPLNSKTSDTACDSPCDGIDSEICGGSNAWTVYLTGMTANVGSSDESSSSASASMTTPQTTPAAIPSSTPSGNTQDSGSPSIIRVASTVFVTQPGSTSASIIYTTEVAKPSGPNKAAIAAGVVVGVVGICAIIGAVIFYLRQRRRRAVEEEYRRNATISNYTAHDGKPPSTTSLPDSRLEPSVMMQRRLSDGSIADNQDYSRRILKVTNPDGT
ncbi:hypothetical protein MMC24_001759 [Lignoscripta atroalba]|nr:hypothetical protein [Lignoscripta atroalba]